jgi:hypothetical protein
VCTAINSNVTAVAAPLHPRILFVVNSIRTSLIEYRIIDGKRLAFSN